MVSGECALLWKLNFKISIFYALIFDLWPSYLSLLEWWAEVVTRMLFHCEMGLGWWLFFKESIYLSRLRLSVVASPKGYIFNNCVIVPASHHISIILTQGYVASRRFSPFLPVHRALLNERSWSVSSALRKWRSHLSERKVLSCHDPAW